VDPTPANGNGTHSDRQIVVNLPSEVTDPSTGQVLESLENLPDKLAELGDETSNIEITVIALPPRGR